MSTAFIRRVRDDYRQALPLPRISDAGAALLIVAHHSGNGGLLRRLAGCDKALASVASPKAAAVDGMWHLYRRWCDGNVARAERTYYVKMQFTFRRLTRSEMIQSVAGLLLNAFALYGHLKGEHNWCNRLMQVCDVFGLSGLYLRYVMRGSVELYHGFDIAFDVVKLAMGINVIPMVRCSREHMAHRFPCYENGVRAKGAVKRFRLQH